MRALKITTALGSISGFLLSAQGVLAAAGATKSATKSATKIATKAAGGTLPEAGITDFTFVLLFAAALLVFFGTIGLIKKANR